MTINYVNNELLWLQNILWGYFHKCWLWKMVKCPKSIFIRQLFSIRQRYLPQQDCPQQNIKWGIAAFYGTWFYQTFYKKMSPPHWIKLSCLPAPFPFDTRNVKFYILFILVFCKKTWNLSLRGGQNLTIAIVTVRPSMFEIDHRLAPHVMFVM